MRRAAASAQRTRASSYSLAEAVRFLATQGVPEDIVRGGSMPETSLEFAGAVLRERLPRHRPVSALHVGTFVGLSLTYSTALLREHHPESVVVSVDPNIRHRGVDDPQHHVMSLLGHFGLLPNSLVITGYTLEQWIGDDPVGELADHWIRERACEHVLDNLSRLCGRRFDAILLDGNDDGVYLARELVLVRELLASSGLVIVDDVVAGIWDEIVSVFEQIVQDANQPFVRLGQDGRIGVLQLRPGLVAAG